MLFRSVFVRLISRLFIRTFISPAINTISPEIIEISKDKVNLVTGAITQPFAEMVWVTTGGDMETVNRLTDVLVTMNTPADRGKLFKIIKMLYGLMGLPFSEEAEPMDADPAVLEYFIFSFTADFGEVIQDLIAEEAE